MEFFILISFYHLNQPLPIIDILDVIMLWVIVSYVQVKLIQPWENNGVCSNRTSKTEPKKRDKRVSKLYF